MASASRPAQGPGLKDVVARGDLAGYRPSRFDLELLDVADAAVSKQIPTALVLPVPGTNIGVLLAATMLVSHFVRTRTLNCQVALVTKQLKLRAFYDGLRFGHDRVALVDYYPRTVVSKDSVASPVSNRPPELAGSSGRLHFASEIDRLIPLMPRLSGIVIESQTSRGQDLRQVLAAQGTRVPLVYLTMDATDPSLEYFHGAGAVWTWDAACIAALADLGTVPPGICGGTNVPATAAGTRFTILGPDEGTELDIALAHLWDDLSAIQQHPGGLTFETVQWAWGVFGALSQLLVPVDDYDRYARSSWGTTALGDAAHKAAAYARNTYRDADREYWDILAADLETAVVAARRTNPKPDALAAWVRERASEHRPSLVAVRNRAAMQATIAYLQARPDVPFGWDTDVRVETYADLIAGRVSSEGRTIAFAGPLTQRLSCLFCFPTRVERFVLAHGPWETGRIRRQILGAQGRLGDLAHGVSKTQAAHLLFGGCDVARNTPLPVEVLHAPYSTPSLPRATRDAVWDPFDVQIVRRLGREDLDLEGPAQQSSSGITAEVATIRISFTDGIGFFAPDLLVSKITAGSVVDGAAKSLVPSDRVILIDGGAKRDLFDLLMEKLEDLPEFSTVVMLVVEWHERARRAGFSCSLTYEEILREMHGTAITTPQAIGTWIRGTVHGPSDAEDICRFGRAVGDDFLARRWEAIGRALETMRSHRRKVGRMLASVLSGISATNLEEQGYFDRRLGIHYSDFMEAVSVHSITGVSKELTRIPYQYANRLLRPEEAAQVKGEGTQRHGSTRSA